MACTVHESGGDEQDLGRWAWTTYRGTNNHFTTVISIYHPCKTDTKQSITSVEALQLEALAEKYPGERRQPFREFRKDLKKLIRSKLDKEHQVIVGGDFNQSMKLQRDNLSKMLQSMGLREIILEKYGKDEAPNTTKRGSTPVDGVWATSAINIIRGGYDDWNLFSDHRTLWFDIDENIFLGRNLEPITRPKCRRLQVSNPKIRKKYNEIMEEQLEK